MKAGRRSSAFHDAWGYYPGAEFVPGGPVGQTSKRWMTKQWDASTVVPAKTDYGVKAPGYNGTDRFRFGCSLNAAGQVLCYSYATGIGVKGDTGNPGDDLAQYGWHVEILSQTDSTAKLQHLERHVRSRRCHHADRTANPVRRADDIDVHVQAKNIGGMMDAFFYVPLSPNVAYVDDSANGGAYPVTSAQAAALAAKHGMSLAAIPQGAAGTVVGVAYVTQDLATGAMADFSFQVQATVGAGTISHTATVSVGGRVVNLTSNPVEIGRGMPTSPSSCGRWA